MKAKFATTCASCRQAIAPGEEIVSAGSGKQSGWSHAACKPGLFDAVMSVAGSSAHSSNAEGSTAQSPSAPSSRAPVGRAAAGAAKKTATKPKVRRVEAPIPPGVTAVYTDGSCSGNPGPGGWAWAVADGRQASGGANPTTNQRMEVQAAYEAIRALADSPLVVVSDSTYVVNCFRDEWWKGWRARGWTTSAKQPVANRDLWEPLIDLVEARGDISFRWVKGHSGDKMNDVVDQLAVEATAAQQRKR